MIQFIWLKKAGFYHMATIKRRSTDGRESPLPPSPSFNQWQDWGSAEYQPPPRRFFLSWDQAGAINELSARRLRYSGQKAGDCIYWPWIAESYLASFINYIRRIKRPACLTANSSYRRLIENDHLEKGRSHYRRLSNELSSEQRVPPRTWNIWSLTRRFPHRINQRVSEKVFHSH